MALRTTDKARPPSRRRAAPAAVLLALCLAACVRTSAPAAAATAPLERSPDGRPLQVTFADEFNGFRRWSNGQGVWRTVFKDGKVQDEWDLRTIRGNKELQLYVDPEMRPKGVAGGRPLGLNPFQARNGVLELIAQPTPRGLEAPLGGYRYTSGLITTQPSFSQTYGYFEMRAKLPRGKGVWPAFWLLPADLSWPPEIDVMESIGDPSVVWATAHSKAGKFGGNEHRISPDDFHVFAVSWDEKQLIWFIDGREVERQPTPPDMHKPMYMLANVALGGDWAGQPDASTPWPARLTIDYIRAYRFAR